MNDNGHLEVHYINTGFQYTATDSFMDFFEGLPHPFPQYAHTGPLHDQESAYWSMNVNSYKYGLPSPGITPFYDPYMIENYAPRMDLNRSAWEYPVTMSIAEPTPEDVQAGGDAVQNMQAIPEECQNPISDRPYISGSSPARDSASSSQAIWQDNVDPDNMTYEELLDLGEAIGTESRGLSKELINSLPTSRYKSSGFFLRKKSGDRCVICQMRYKRGDGQITLPCKHVYHTECGSKWLSINKTCPICNVEVLCQESS